jgi:lipid A 4'-phosphatase
LLLYLHKSIYVISGIILVFLPLAFIYNVLTNKKLFNTFGKKEIIYLALCIAIGPGLIVNHTFKNNYFGRARPSHIKEFGGDKEFSPLFKVSKNCATNCSFSSGHAALAFYLTAFALILKKRQRMIFVLAIVFGNLVGLARIAQGGHFLSDIIFSAIIVMGVNILLYNWMFRDR